MKSPLLLVEYPCSLSSHRVIPSKKPSSALVLPWPTGYCLLQCAGHANLVRGLSCRCTTKKQPWPVAWGGFSPWGQCIDGIDDRILGVMADSHSPPVERPRLGQLGQPFGMCCWKFFLQGIFDAPMLLAQDPEPHSTQSCCLVRRKQFCFNWPSIVAGSVFPRSCYFAVPAAILTAVLVKASGQPGGGNWTVRWPFLTEEGYLPL